MLRKLQIVPAQTKTGNTSEKLPNEIRKKYILFIKQKKLLKKYRTI